MSLRWPYVHALKVPWRDLDAAGHVNNAVYLSYMEDARCQAYFAITGGTRAEDLDIILARASVDYRSPAFMGETLLVEVRPGRVGESSFVFTYTIREKGSQRLVAEGESVLVCYDYQKEQKKRVPDKVRAALAAG